MATSSSERARRWLVGGGVAFVFVSFGVWELINPMYWTGFVPTFLMAHATTLVRIHGTILTIAGLWVLSRWKLRWAAILATLMMIEVSLGLLISSGFSSLFVRDLAILAAAASLFFERDARW